MINFFIKTYGCQANVADSQAVANFLVNLDCKQVYSEKLADLIIINTCAIREKSEQKIYSYLGRLAKLQKRNSLLKIIVIGCVASYKKKDFYVRFGFITFVSGSRDDKNVLRDKLIDIVLSMQTSKSLLVPNKKDFLDNQDKNNFKLGGVRRETRHSTQSFINIMTGCNNFCTYCIVPFTRGSEISYSSKEILEKIKQDIALGTKEIFLLGQNVNSYKCPETNLNFAQLLEAVAKLEGDFWVRFVSSHPKDMTLDVIKVMAKYKEKVCGFVHHPLQSGSNKILKAMNRSYTLEKYLKQVDWIRNYLPDATISTDIIVGFPGETDQDFEQTLEVIKKIKFDNIFSFIYSPRKFTKAAMLKDNLSYEQKQSRLAILQKIQVDISRANNENYVGCILKCLVEKEAVNGMLLARSAGNHTILFDGDLAKIDTFVNIKINSARATNLIGSLIE